MSGSGKEVHWKQNCWVNLLYFVHLYPEGSNHLLRMVMEPKYVAEEVIVHPNHHLTR